MTIEDYAKRHPKVKGANLAPEIIENIGKLKVGSKILDIGCAEGLTIKSLYEIWGSKYTYYGVDLSKTRIKKAKNLEIPNSKFIASSGESTPFEDSFLDCILCSQVLEHVDNPNGLLAEIYRLLKSGGIFEVDTVYKRKWAWYFYRAPIGWALDPTHLREYTSLSEVENLFKRNKLQVEDIFINPSYRNLNQKLPLNLKIRIPGYYTLFILGEK
jgi:ubiquinone/menaquinone biosynthesis C-methylase UbiE